MNNTIDQHNMKTIYNKINETINEDISTISKETIQIIDKYLDKGEKGYDILLNFLIFRRHKKKNKLTLVDGLIFNHLYESNIASILEELKKVFPDGIVPLKESLKLDYKPLQQLLIEKQFQEADKITQNYLCNLAGLDSNKNRRWLYFTDVSSIPAEDLFTIDLLWKIYSKGKFGFSIQRRIWILNNYNWEKLWQQIGWIEKGSMRRYPQEFIWTLSAPKGHLPLFNQLRGNQVLSSLFEHIVWQKNISIN